MFSWGILVDNPNNSRKKPPAATGVPLMPASNTTIGKTEDKRSISKTDEIKIKINIINGAPMPLINIIFRRALVILIPINILNNLQPRGICTIHFSQANKEIAHTANRAAHIYLYK